MKARRARSSSGKSMTPKFQPKVLRRRGHIDDRGNDWIARRIDIANHWRAQFPEN
jgi:hypothetical protein